MVRETGYRSQAETEDECKKKKKKKLITNTADYTKEVARAVVINESRIRHKHNVRVILLVTRLTFARYV